MGGRGHCEPMVTHTPSCPRLVVFSDLDGTLLDHTSYDWSPAQPALDCMLDLGIPLVLASSKTAFEIYELRAEMGFSHVPAIVENGAGLLRAGEIPNADSNDYTALLAALSDIPLPLRRSFQGFSQWSVDQIARETGLSVTRAALAAQRQFSEPGRWVGAQDGLDAFIAALSERGVFARRGGRFLTLSFGATKADHMADIVSKWAPPPLSLALGDAPNDTDMIAAADFGVIITNPDAPPLAQMAGEATGRITRSTDSGPVGWNKSVLERIEQIYDIKR
ncbi:HAD-IIB family hydrolase [Celeribacter marinus]|uniref:HAD-IIB family hydrolase n=1 Tax=Celeribacter marinus TaxID=1397108 RepID=UPI00316C2600